MGQVDSVTKAYVQHNVVFADIFNQFIYDGRQVIQPDNLRELDTTALGRGRNGKMLQKNRDVLKLAMKTDGRTAYCILGVENQTKIHYAMVVRNMLYDALRLDEQVRHICTRNGKNKKYRNEAEFLGRFTKEDRILPVITVVIHFGPEPWDGATELRELYACDDEAIMRLAPGYKLNLIDPAHMSENEITQYKTGMREIMQYLKYANDKELLQAAVNNNPRFQNVDRETANVINVTANAGLKYTDTEEMINMCKAIEDMRAESKAEGREEMRREMHSAIEDMRAESKAEGRAEGREEGRAEGHVEGRAEGRFTTLLEAVRNIMSTLHYDQQKAMDLLKVPADMRAKMSMLL